VRSTFKRDVHCPCGYNLRGLTLPRRCPECGQAVRLLAGQWLWDCDPRWIRRLRVGAALLVAHLLAYPATLPLVWLLQQLSPRSWHYRFAWLLPSLVLTTAVWWITAPDPRPVTSRRVRARARLLRNAAVVMTLFSAVYWSVDAFNRVHRLWHWRDRDALNRAELGWALAWMLVAFLLFRHLRHFFRRVRNPGAAITCTCLSYLLPTGMLFLQLPDAIWLQLGEDWLPSFLPREDFGGILLAFGVLITLVIVVMFWIDLNHAVEGMDLTPRRARRDVLTNPRGSPLEPDLQAIYASVSRQRPAVQPG
jgi:hypothetical protein